MLAWKGVVFPSRKQSFSFLSGKSGVAATGFRGVWDKSRVFVVAHLFTFLVKLLRYTRTPSQPRKGQRQRNHHLACPPAPVEVPTAEVPVVTSVAGVAHSSLWLLRANPADSTEAGTSPGETRRRNLATPPPKDGGRPRAGIKKHQSKACSFRCSRYPGVANLVMHPEPVQRKKYCNAKGPDFPFGAHASSTPSPQVFAGIWGANP